MSAWTRLVPIAVRRVLLAATNLARRCGESLRQQGVRPKKKSVHTAPSSINMIFFWLFFVALGVIIFPHAKRLFFPSFGRRHRVAGALHLFVLVLASLDTSLASVVALGISGIAVTLTAAHDFPHKTVRNAASGTLDEAAIVTYSEMIEHSFYQALNLVQILYLRCGDYGALGLVLATAPWLLRKRFPINKFSDNYAAGKVESSPSQSRLIRIMYFVKKCQYLAYKHVFLHGLNLTVYLRPEKNFSPTSLVFRRYWVGLNTSYVMEFFLQTLVKRRYMKQNTMLGLQLILMSASSVAGLNLLLLSVDLRLATLSLVANFANRHHDFLNTVAIATLTRGYSHFSRAR